MINKRTLILSGLATGLMPLAARAQALYSLPFGLGSNGAPLFKVMINENGPFIMQLSTRSNFSFLTARLYKS